MERLERYLGWVGERCEELPDKRRGTNSQYSMADIGLAALSVFFMQSPSFLAHQRALAHGRGRSNCQTLFGMTKIPSDNHIRKMLDGVPADHFASLFTDFLADIEAHAPRRTRAIRRAGQAVCGGLEDFRRLADPHTPDDPGRLPIALDGTEHFRSKKIGCKQCLERQVMVRTGVRERGKDAVGEKAKTALRPVTEYFHSFLGAAVVSPGQSRVLPLPPEFITRQDGAQKQDCERVAAKRWLATHGPGLAAYRPVYLGDDLYACQPICEAVEATGASFIFVCKPGSHPVLSEYVSRIGLAEHVETLGKGKARRRHRYRWLADVPLRDGKDAMTVNWIEIEISDPANDRVTYRNSFVTDLAVCADTVAEIVSCGRARWKIENETFNVLKNAGYNIEHNFGHGKNGLASILVVLNLLAFAMHTACDLLEDAWREAARLLGARKRLFEHMRSITVYIVFGSWHALMTTIATGIPPPQL